MKRLFLSFRRRPESSQRIAQRRKLIQGWIPAFAGMTLALGSGFLPVVAYSAQDLDALLLEIQHQQSASAQINKEREARFLRDKAERERLYQEALGELRALESHIGSRRAQFDAGQREIQQLQDELNRKAGDISQLAALVRQAATELKAQDQESLVAAQYPERAKFLEELAQSKTLPDTATLEKLWFLYQQAMTESGKSARFVAAVMAVDGTTEKSTVARAGPFAAVRGGEYLQWLPASGKFQVLARQPHGAGLAEEWASQQTGVALLVIDPTAGVLLGLLTRRPDFLDRTQQGGLVGYVIMVLGVLGLAIAAWQGLALRSTGRAIAAQLENLKTPRSDNALGRVLIVYDPRQALDLETLELKLDEAILRETPRLERGLGLLKLLTGVAPLLGLLGTVVGMILTFQVITEYGSGDPKLMAGGISTALVTTVQGLVVAIPLLFLHSLLATRSRALIRILDEQAAGLLARSLEISKGARRA